MKRKFTFEAEIPDYFGIDVDEDTDGLILQYVYTQIGAGICEKIGVIGREKMKFKKLQAKKILSKEDKQLVGLIPIVLKSVEEEIKMLETMRKSLKFEKEDE